MKRSQELQLRPQQLERTNMPRFTRGRTPSHNRGCPSCLGFSTCETVTTDVVGTCVQEQQVQGFQKHMAVA